MSCESTFNNYRPHEVEDQQGLYLPKSKNWVETFGPWLVVSVAGIIISAKIAAKNVVLPGVGLVSPSFQWQQAAAMSDETTLATAVSTYELNEHIMDGMGLDANDTHQDPRVLNGKNGKVLSEFLGKLTVDEYEKKLALRKVHLRYNGGSHGVVRICRERVQKFESMKVKVVTELPI